MESIRNRRGKLRTKRLFLKKGTCSNTFFYILNREFNNPMDIEETAIDPLAGGIVNHGFQCGMLWGAAMALGAEAYKRCNSDINKAAGLTVLGTQSLLDSFVARTGTVNCSEITRLDFAGKWQLVKYLLSGKFYNCFRMAGKWAPEAIKTAKKALDKEPSDLPDECVSCAFLTAREMGASDKEAVMLSGFAGGLGLSGEGCGALAAAIWMKTYKKLKTDTWKYAISDPLTTDLMKRFFKETDNKITCKELCNRSFASIEEHSDFISNGGCEPLIHFLANL